jgi:apolipoprotein N-acyltransferase
VSEPVAAPELPVDKANAESTSPAAVSRRTAYLLAFATGTLYFLGFAGTDIWPCALVALVPMAVAMEGQSARRSLEIGAIAGFTMNMIGFTGC